MKILRPRDNKKDLYMSVKKINIVLHDVPEGAESCSNIRIFCDKDCGKQCEDVKECVWPNELQAHLANKLQGHEILMETKYQGYRGDKGIYLEENELRVDINFQKKDRADFTIQFLNEVVRANRQKS